VLGAGSLAYLGWNYSGADDVSSTTTPFTVFLDELELVEEFLDVLVFLEVLVFLLAEFVTCLADLFTVAFLAEEELLDALAVATRLAVEAVAAALTAAFILDDYLLAEAFAVAVVLALALADADYLAVAVADYLAVAVADYLAVVLEELAILAVSA